MLTTTSCDHCGFEDPPPTTQHAHGTPKWRDSQRARLAHTKQQTSALEARLASLDTERQALEEVLETFSYPVLSTPVELISEIFIACLPDNGRVQPSRYAAPLVLAQICRQWREIALATPQLWRSVDFAFMSGKSMGMYPDIRFRTVSYSDGEDSDDSGAEERKRVASYARDAPYDGACSLIRTWFHRAKGCPLSITLRCAPTRPAMPPKILPTIAEFCAHWGRLEITLPSVDFRALESIPGPFPELRTLAVDLGRHGQDTERLTVFQAAPQLRIVRLFKSGLTLDNVLLGTTMLTTLELGERLSKEECVAIFMRFPALRHLTASFSFDFDSNDTVAFQHVPPLQSLIIDPSPDPIGMLTLPHLRRLKYFLDSRRTNRFLAFLSRSACHLTHLTLRTSSIDNTTLLQCLRAVPHLITFELRRASDNRRLYERLADPTLLPCLQHLAIAESGLFYDYEPVFTMLHMRRAASTGVRLRTFDLSRDPGSSVSDDEIATPPVGSITNQVQRFAADGLRVRVHTRAHHKWPVDAKDKDGKDFP
ncbi:hypothetical protein C8R46DRAFT_1057195 [Mycena filopes]|nr:hypothetical protein C8R46DRAFT_1057195 [Mycena filopes]